MNRKLIVIDFETTGLTPHKDYPHQVAAIAIDPDSGVISEELVLDIRLPFRAWLRVPTEAFAGAQAVHKRSTSDLFFSDEAVSVREAARALTEMAKRHPEASIAGHNVHFDYGFMKRLFQLARMDFPFKHRLVDLSTLGYFMTGEQKLNKIAEKLGIKMDKDRAHTAGYDTMVTADCLTRIFQRREAVGFLK